MIKTIDATTGQAVTDVLVTFSSDNVDGNGVSDSDGFLLLGSFVSGSVVSIKTSKSGYEDGTDEVLVGNTDTTREVAMNPLTGEDRVVLSWGEKPEDLDLHLVMFTGSGTSVCEIFYSSRDCPGATLDRDNTQVGFDMSKIIIIGNTFFLGWKQWT